MADLGLRAATGLEHLTTPGRRGRHDGAAGLALALRSGLAMASVIARKDALAALLARAQGTVGIALPERTGWKASGALTMVWAGPGQWLAVEEGGNGTALERRLRELLGTLVSITDQSDGRSVLRLSGPAARDVLAKGMPIDLHPSQFASGDATLTLYSYTHVHIWQVDEKPTYDIAVFRSYAADLWRALVEAGAVYGVDVLGT